MKAREVMKALEGEDQIRRMNEIRDQLEAFVTKFDTAGTQPATIAAALVIVARLQLNRYPVAVRRLLVEGAAGWIVGAKPTTTGAPSTIVVPDGVM